MSGWILRPTMLTDWAAAGVHAQSFQKYVHLIWAAENRDTVVTGLPLWTPAAPPVFFLFLLLFLLLRSTRNELCTTPCTRWCHPWEHSASAVCSCAVVLILCLPPSLPVPPSLPLSLLTFSYAYSPSHSTLALSLPIFFLFLTHPPPFSSLSFCGFVSFHQVSKWLYWWSLSNLRYGQFLPYVNFLFCHSVRLSSCHACMLGVERLHWFHNFLLGYYLIVVSVPSLMTHSQAGTV